MKIELTKDRTSDPFLQTILDAEKRSGLSTEKIAKKIQEKIGGTLCSRIVQYRFFKRGERGLPKKMQECLIEILDIPKEDVTTTRTSALKISFECLHEDTDISQYLNSVPLELRTLPKFLIYLKTESERNSLLEKV